MLMIQEIYFYSDLRSEFCFVKIYCYYRNDSTLETFHVRPCKGCGAFRVIGFHATLHPRPMPLCPSQNQLVWENIQVGQVNRQLLDNESHVKGHR